MRRSLFPHRYGHESRTLQTRRAAVNARLASSTSNARAIAAAWGSRLASAIVNDNVG
jgi:hypothetical protein